MEERSEASRPTVAPHIHTRLKVSEKYGVKLCLFDKEGAELYDKYTWALLDNKTTFYLKRCLTIDGKYTTMKFHRELLNLEEGEIRDHRNGNGLDNRLSNLRVANQQQNCCNRNMQRNNTSGIKGVIWYKQQQKWGGIIQYNGVRHYLGLFDDIKEAEKVVRAERERLHGEFVNHGSN